MASRKYFTKEFKLEAVRQLEQSGKSGTELARQLGIRRNQLYKWQHELRSKTTRAFPGGGQHPQVQDEVVRLKRELERVSEERDILKKAAVDSIIQRNTFILMLHFREGGVYGSNGTPRSFRFPEVGTLAALEGRRIA